MLVRLHPIVCTLVLTALLLPGSPALAQVAEILIVPVGKGQAFEPTAKVATAMARLLNKGAKVPVAALYFPFPASPPPSKRSVRKAVKLRKQLRRAFDQMAYAKAARLADKLRDIEKDMMKRGRGSKGYVAALHYLAAIAQSNDKIKKSFKYMNDAVLFNNKPPSKATFNPEVLRLHQRVMAERSAAGKLTLESSPAGLIWFNNTLEGLAVGKLKKPAGLYLVRYFRPGHIPRKRWVRVKAHRERDLATVLNKDESPEPEIIGQLRKDAKGKDPGDTIKKLALEQASIHVVLVGATRGCKPDKCTISVAWAEEDVWKLKKKARLKGDVKKVALSLMPELKLRATQPDEDEQQEIARQKAEKEKKRRKLAATPLTVSQCITNSQCPARHKCEAGRCVKHVPVTKKWWFWTIVGAAVVGATVGIAVPLSMPDSPVIEVR